ncbi:dipeptide ABC transporter ATP-binding protein [bacterium]|nr:dipeptide ABC transporter ATP-binding protein [bacterium]
MKSTLLSARNVKKYYPLKTGAFSRKNILVKAVDDISLDIQKGEIFGLVGESGCGKSTLGRILLRFEELTSGTVMFQGENLGDFDRKKINGFRRQAQMIYQDPYSSLNPRKKIGSLIQEPLDIHRIGTLKERKEKVHWLLEKVGLQPDQARRYPHEFSGGQRQRIVVARALALNPLLLMADEPVSALDVSIQAQVINLLLDLREEFALTYLFISHDLSVVEHLSDRVAVMYLGKIVESADKDAFYSHPLHPYSRALLSAAPVPDLNGKKQRLILQGDVPSPINPPSGCAFHPRCPLRMPECDKSAPELKERAPGHRVACFAQTD